MSLLHSGMGHHILLRMRINYQRHMAGVDSLYTYTKRPEIEDLLQLKTYCN